MAPKPAHKPTPIAPKTNSSRAYHEAANGCTAKAENARHARSVAQRLQLAAAPYTVGAQSSGRSLDPLTCTDTTNAESTK